MKKTIIRSFGTIILLLILIMCLIGTGRLLERKESYNRYSSYFTEKQQIDVLIIGTSHIRHGIFPMELWGNYGITSYNLAGNASTIPVSFWVLTNALDYNTPKIVVMDTFDAMPGRIFSTYWGNVQDQFDAFPLSYNKYKMIKDLFGDETLTDGNGVPIYDKRWELLLNLGAYHTRWEDLGEEDFSGKMKIEENSRIWKGSSPLIGVVRRNERTYPIDENTMYDERAREYLEKIINLCREKNIELILVNTGYDCSDEAKLFQDSVSEIASRNNVRCIDITDMDLIDFNTDLWSSGDNTHLNFSGAEKLTDYIGQTLMDYDLEDHRGDPAYNKWNVDYMRFVESKHNYLREQKEITDYLIMLKDKDYDIDLELLNGRKLSETTINLLNNLGYNIEYRNDSVYFNGKEISESNSDESDEYIHITAYSRSTAGVVDSRSF